MAANPTDLGYRLYRVHLCWHSSLSPSSHRLYLCGGLLQTRCRLYLCQYHRQQELVGLRGLKVHHAVDNQGWVLVAYFDEHVTDHIVVPVRNPLLVEGKDI